MNKFFNLGAVKVSFSHEYEPKQLTSKKDFTTRIVLTPRATTVVVKTDDAVVHATAVCSHRDAFVYETGRKTALRKAFAQLSLTKEEKRRVWEEYSKLKPGGRW
jgi:hypothetical protein